MTQMRTHTCGQLRLEDAGKRVTLCGWLENLRVVGAGLGNLAYLFSEHLLRIYITDSAEAIRIGMLRMSIISTLYFLDGMMEVMTGTLRGMGKSALPMAVTVLGMCVFRVVWLFTVFRIPAYHSLTTVYVSYPITWILTFTVELIAFLMIMRKLKPENTR